MKIGVIGATGYAGEFLVRILDRHNDAEIAYLSSSHAAGKNIAEVIPSLTSVAEYPLEKEDPDTAAERCDCVFVAKKSVESMKYAPLLLEKGVRVIDIGGEFRLKDPSAYKQWYGNEHTCPHLLQQAVYGLPEYNRKRIQNADLVSNPGCYPTAVLLVLKPFIESLGDSITNVNISASSGLTGAGRTPSATGNNLFVNCFNSHSAYKPVAHKHTPEIEQESGVDVTFVPQLASVDRGILAVVHINLKKGYSPDRDPGRILQDTYVEEPFVRVCGNVRDVSTASVRGTNFCDVFAAYSERTGTIVAVSAVDNLIKGASGQAVQNMNIMYGIDETETLLGEMY